MTYTYEQVLAYEVARELINSHIADCSAAIAEEQAKSNPKTERLASLDDRQTGLVVERRRMDMTDDAGVASVTAKYRRPEQK